MDARDVWEILSLDSGNKKIQWGYHFTPRYDFRKIPCVRVCSKSVFSKDLAMRGNNCRK